MIGYIVVTQMQYEGMKDQEGPYPLYLDQAKAQAAADALDDGFYYGDVLPVEIDPAAIQLANFAGSANL